MGYLALLGPSFFSLQDFIEPMFSLVLLFWWHHFFGGFLGSSHQVLVLWVCWLVFGIDILLMLFESFFIFSSMHLTTPSFVSFSFLPILPCRLYRLYLICLIISGVVLFFAFFNPLDFFTESGLRLNHNSFLPILYRLYLSLSAIFCQFL